MERNAKYVVRSDEEERGRSQEMVGRGQGSKTIRDRALISLKADEASTARRGSTRRSPRRSAWACEPSSAPGSNS